MIFSDDFTDGALSYREASLPVLLLSWIEGGDEDVQAFRRRIT